MRLGISVGLLLLAPVAAHGATVGGAVDYANCTRYGCDTSPAVVFTAAQGEANRLSVTVTGQVMTVTDAGAVLSVDNTRRPGACRAIDAHTAECDMARTRATLGDGDDEASGTLDTVDGGEGADRLTGGPGADRLIGGPGADTLIGGDGDDTLAGGLPSPPDETVKPAADSAEADVIDGGAGSDTADYGGRSTPVVIDLAGAGRGEDTLSEVEHAIAGAGDDRLYGGPGVNLLFGGPGDDVVDGGAGDDLLDGETGRDVVSGGAGADRLYPGSVVTSQSTDQEGNVLLVTDTDPDRAADRVACGDGSGDRVTWTDRADRVARDCERIHFQGPPDQDDDSEVYMVSPLRRSGPRVYVSVGCLHAETCQDVVVRVGRARSRAVDIRSGRRRTVTVRLRRPLPRSPVIEVRSLNSRGAVTLSAAF